MPAGRGGGNVPGTFLRALHPAAGAQEHSVATADLDAGEFFPRVEIGRGDWRAGLEVGDVFHARDVDENPARHDAGLLMLDAVLRAAWALRDLGALEAIVDLAFERVVAQRVDVRD